MMSGMSCSIRSTEADSSFCDRYDQRPECLRLTLRQPGRRLVETQHLGIERKQAREFDDAAGPRRQIGM